MSTSEDARLTAEQILITHGIDPKTLTPEQREQFHRGMTTALAVPNSPLNRAMAEQTAASASTSQETCPVDHSTRSAWLESQGQSQKPKPTSPTATCDSSTMDQQSSIPYNINLPPQLNSQREVSTIPRVIADNGNSEQPVEHARGNWIYPSEQMFFAAMKRKNWDPRSEDMSSIVPIHNAVNERAWAEIKSWETGRGAEKCGGPKLVSFSGDASKLSPKARLFVLFGYSAPFDRHDWTVDRCGTRVDYIIDFYSGKRDPQNPGMPSFYLDVRPKLGFEGAYMRMRRWMQSLF